MTYEQMKELLELAANLKAAPADRRKAVQILTEADARGGAAGGREPDDDVKAFDAWLHRKGGIPQRSKASLVEGTDANGGYLVPTKYSDELVQTLREMSILRKAGARVLSVAGTDSFRVPSMTDSAAATIGAEGSAYPQSEPTFAEIEFNPFKAKKLSKASEEVVADSRFPIWDAILRPDYEQAFDAGENRDFTTGTGSGAPQGVTVGASAGVTAAGAAAITADELIDLYHALDWKYRQNAVFMMNDSTVKLIRKLKDSTNQYLWQPGLQAGQPDTLLGRPLITNNNMPAATTGNRSVIFGDMRYFWICDFQGGQLSVQRLDELYAADGYVGFRAFKRYDSNVMLSAAIKALTQA